MEITYAADLPALLRVVLTSSGRRPPAPHRFAFTTSHTLPRTPEDGILDASVPAVVITEFIARAEGSGASTSPSSSPTRTSTPTQGGACLPPDCTSAVQLLLAVAECVAESPTIAHGGLSWLVRATMDLPVALLPPAVRIYLRQLRTAHATSDADLPTLLSFTRTLVGTWLTVHRQAAAGVGGAASAEWASAEADNAVRLVAACACVRVAGGFSPERYVDVVRDVVEGVASHASSRTCVWAGVDALLSLCQPEGAPAATGKPEPSESRLRVVAQEVSAICRRARLLDRCVVPALASAVAAGDAQAVELTCLLLRSVVALQPPGARVASVALVRALAGVLSRTHAVTDPVLEPALMAAQAVQWLLPGDRDGVQAVGQLLREVFRLAGLERASGCGPLLACVTDSTAAFVRSSPDRCEVALTCGFVDAVVALVRGINVRSNMVPLDSVAGLCSAVNALLRSTSEAGGRHVCDAIAHAGVLDVFLDVLERCLLPSPSGGAPCVTDVDSGYQRAMSERQSAATVTVAMLECLTRVTLNSDVGRQRMDQKWDWLVRVLSMASSAGTVPHAAALDVQFGTLVLVNALLLSPGPNVDVTAAAPTTLLAKIGRVVETTPRFGCHLLACIALEALHRSKGGSNCIPMVERWALAGPVPPSLGNELLSESDSNTGFSVSDPIAVSDAVRSWAAGYVPRLFSTLRDVLGPSSATRTSDRGAEVAARCCIALAFHVPADHRLEGVRVIVNALARYPGTQATTGAATRCYCLSSSRSYDCILPMHRLAVLTALCDQVRELCNSTAAKRYSPCLTSRRA